jgi:hypothetical protein
VKKPEEKKPPEDKRTPAELIEALAKCEFDFKCDAYKPIVALGAKVAPDVLKLVLDADKPQRARAVATKALGEIKDAATGKALYGAGMVEKDVVLRMALYDAVGAIGGDEVFALAQKDYLTDAGWQVRVDLSRVLVAFGARARDWAAGEIGKHAGDKFETALADIIVATSDKNDLPKLVELLAHVKDAMAAHRLAAKAVALGDVAKVDVMIKGLADENEFNRSDAANMLARVADKIPADQKDHVIELVKAARAKDKGGLTSMGYDSVLKKLGAP